MIFSISWALILVRNVLCIAEAVWDSDGHCWLFSICDHFGNNLVGANTFQDSFSQLMTLKRFEQSYYILNCYQVYNYGNLYACQCSTSITQHT